MNWSKFLSMGGYAFYVWGSYLIALFVMGGEVMLVLKRRNSLRQETRRQQGTDRE